jgi:hypothetical protein
MSDLTDRFAMSMYASSADRHAAMLTEIDRLTAEVQQLRADNTDLQNKVVMPLQEQLTLAESVRAAQVAGLTDGLAKLEQDAARYRYLRDIKRQECLVLKGPEAGVWCDCENQYGELILLTEGDLDAAIDAALNGEAG